MTRNGLSRLALLLLPTVVLAGWALSIAIKRADLPVMRVAIVGYDPRDLLRGHYLQFRLDLAPGEAAPCACLEPNPADALRPIARPVSCPAPSAPPPCPNYVDMPRQTFRYYLPQEKALEYEKLLRQSPGAASTLVHFHSGGRLSFSDLVAGPAK